MKVDHKHSGMTHPLRLAVLGLVWFAAFKPALAVPQYLGDLNEDGFVSVLDVVMLVNHLQGSAFLDQEVLPFADVNTDSLLDELDVKLLSDTALERVPIQDYPMMRALRTSPVDS